MITKDQVVESITVREFYERGKEVLELDLVANPDKLERIIGEKSLNRPALAVAGYFRFFAAKRIQLFGAGEMAYLRDFDGPTATAALEEFARRHVPCIIISRNLAPTPSLLKVVNQFKIPLFRSPLKSKNLSTEATLLLEEQFAPRTAVHGTLIDVKGVGTLITGESGIGKSECALALIERGHSLVADDLTYVRLLRDHELVGSSSQISRGYMECRGIGIIDVAKLFGVRSVRMEKRIDVVISFENWHTGMEEDRTGLNRETITILGRSLPHTRIPVRPGRDLARLVEVAALVEALKIMGHDGAQEFNERLIQTMQGS